MRTFIYTIFITLLLAATFSCGSRNNNSHPQNKDSLAPDTGSTQPTGLNETDKTFAKGAAEGGLFEVMMGELAVKNGSSTSIKELGQMMADDHSKINQELKDLAGRKNITLPEKLGEDKQAKYDEFTQKKGKDFDKAYAALMVEDHIIDIEHFQEEAGNGQDKELSDWANDKLSTLEHHLDMSKKVNKDFK